MPTWIIEPRDSLVVRDGRTTSFGFQGRTVSYAFPLPSTITGGVRNRAGLDATGIFDRSLIATVKQIAVRGPMLVELHGEGSIEWYSPAPGDALVLDLLANHNSLFVRWLEPVELSEELATDLPLDLLPVTLPEGKVAPTSPYAPRFWRWSSIVAWLARPRDYSLARAELGIEGPLLESRVHAPVSMESGTVVENRLFETTGLSFTDSERRRLALAVEVSHSFSHFSGGLAPLGGERRLVAWHLVDEKLPTCPLEVREAIIRDGACRVLLLTPGIFFAGFRPTRLLEPTLGVSPRLVAAAVSHPQTISGWDMEIRAPKPTRRLAPAGSVYFLHLEGTPAARAAWVDAHWMQCVCDEEQDRRDGFGLGVLGVWNGRPLSLEGFNAGN